MRKRKFNSSKIAFVSLQMFLFTIFMTPHLFAEDRTSQLPVTPAEIILENKELREIVNKLEIITLDQIGEDSPNTDNGQEVEQKTEYSIPSQELVRMAWEASSKGDLERIDKIFDEIMTHYGAKAQEQAASLQDFPPRGKEGEYQAMNDVATVMFIKAEALMNYGQSEKALTLFKEIIARYPYAKAWDPRGWYWSVAEKSEASIQVIEGRIEDPGPEPEAPGLKTMPNLKMKGTKNIVDYTKFGKFHDVGSEKYSYEVTDPGGLSKAVGESIYPNTGAVLKNPAFRKARKEGRLGPTHWDFVHSDDLEAALFKWSTASEPWGIKLFYIGTIFEKAKMYHEAIKAYHALVVHFPKTVGWTYWQTPWYPAQAGIAKIKHIIRTHPELNLKTKWMKIEVNKGFDNDISNDEIITFPGVISEKTWWDLAKERFNLDKKTVPLKTVKKKVGNGKVKLVQFDNGHWQLLVNNQPFVIRGITYAPTKIGQSPDKGTLVSWMYEDTNKNGLADGPYDAWVDRNDDNEQNTDEPVVGDFQLMKEMGVNVIREYHQPFKPNKELLRKMHKQYGFYVIMGDFLGKYGLGSNAAWNPGTDYDNEDHRKNMMDSVRRMVMDFKDEPYVLIWLLGNENNYGVASNADQKPESFYEFANDVAKMIKSIDPDHPVAICNGDTLYLDIFAEHAPDIDIYSANVYRGDYGFGSFWEQVTDASGKPAFITEFGSPSYARHLSKDERETAQANYHRGNWLDIESNVAGRKDGVGNALGGIIFEWTDEWWKNYEPFRHDRTSDAIGPFPGGYYFEEWFGITSQGNGTQSPYLRQLRKSYFAYKEMWNE